MKRRTLILGGAGAVGVAATGALLWPSPHPMHGAKLAGEPGKSSRPALVFVGHEL